MAKFKRNAGSGSRRLQRKRALMFPRIQKVLRMMEISTRVPKKNLGLRYDRARRRNKRQLESPETLQLIPGIPDEVVSLHILPRLPWYQRPVMMAVSTLWKAAISEADDIWSRSQEFLRNTGIVVLLRSPDFPTLEHFDVTVGFWQVLPPLPPGYENAAIRDIFKVDGDLYVVCEEQGEMFRMEMSVGLWYWEESAITNINGAVELAYVNPGRRLHLAGRRLPSSMVHELHGPDNRFVVRFMSPFHLPSTRLCNIKELDRQMYRSRRDDNTTRYQSPHEVYTLPVHVSDTEFYIVREKRYLEYHDMSRHEEWTVIREVDLRRKLKMIGNEKAVALASGERCIYVATIIFFFGIGKLRLWKGCRVCHDPDPGQFAWKLLSSTDRPVEFHWLWSLHDLTVSRNFKNWDAIRMVAM